MDARLNGSGIDGGFFEALGQINWEIDIWGRLRHANRAAMATYLEQEENRKALAGEPGGRGGGQLLPAARSGQPPRRSRTRTLASRKENTRIITARFDEGYTNEVDKLQAIQQEQQAAAAIPSIERQVRQVENALRVLQGLGPGPVERGRPNTEQQLTPDVIPMGLPSQLLERRPDIQAAEANLEALTERAGVSVANRFPMLIAHRRARLRQPGAVDPVHRGWWHGQWLRPARRPDLQLGTQPQHRRGSQAAHPGRGRRTRPGGVPGLHRRGQRAGVLPHLHRGERRPRDTGGGRDARRSNSRRPATITATPATWR